MSSILEALRELERDRARAGKTSTTVAEAPREATRSMTALIPLTGGLAIGVVVFGAYVWTTAFRRAPAPPVAAEAPASPAETPQEPAAAPRHPEWLARAEAPRARVTPPEAAPPPPTAAPRATAAPVPPPAVAPEPEPPARLAPAPAAPPPTTPPLAARPVPPPAAMPEPRVIADPRPVDVPRGGDRQVRVEAIAYSPNVDQRTATLTVNGRRATLRQRESLGGVEVQLIMSDGVYLQRGSDVFFVPRPR